MKRDKTIGDSGLKTIVLRLTGNNKPAVIGLIIFLVICLACAFAPFLTKWDYTVIDAPNKLSPPSLEHILGTDGLGRDVFARLLYGGRVTLRIALVSTVLAAVIGSIVGLAAGYFGKTVDFIISPILDMLASIPIIMLALITEAVLGWGQGNFMYAIAVAAVPQFARLTRASVMSVMGHEYIEASRALGVGHLEIMARRVFHNAAPPLIIRFTGGVAEALLTCTIMGYLGIGVNPPTPEWGSIVYNASSLFRLAPFVLIIPCAAIAVSVISISLFADGLRDALDPAESAAAVRKKKISKTAQGNTRQNPSKDALLEVLGLDVSFHTRRGETGAVNGISYSVKKGEIMGLVGESGSGKSVEAYAVMGLLNPAAVINAGSILYKGRDLLSLSKKEMRALRGEGISLIFQNPMSCLDHGCTIGSQLIETIRSRNKTITKQEAGQMSLEMLREVRIQNPERVMRQYPFELSGGMCQRVVISIALLGNPELLIADEPTTALDVTIQAQIIELLKSLQRRHGMAMVYITHNLGIVAELCDRVSVMCGGYILEQGTAEDIFYRAAHPYTKALLKATPRMDKPAKEPLEPIEGAPVWQTRESVGCVFHTRCADCMDICRTSRPAPSEIGEGHSAACWLTDVSGAAEKAR